MTDLVVQNIEWLGHTRMILKADDVASLALVDASLKMTRLNIAHVEQISTEYPPEYDSQSNGGIGCAHPASPIPNILVVIGSLHPGRHTGPPSGSAMVD